jgi:hypothetical protein
MPRPTSSRSRADRQPKYASCSSEAKKVAPTRWWCRHTTCKTPAPSRKVRTLPALGQKQIAPLRRRATLSTSQVEIAPRTWKYIMLAIRVSQRTITLYHGRQPNMGDSPIWATAQCGGCPANARRAAGATQHTKAPYDTIWLRWWLTLNCPQRPRPWHWKMLKPLNTKTSERCCMHAGCSMGGAHQQTLSHTEPEPPPNRVTDFGTRGTSLLQHMSWEA